MNKKKKIHKRNKYVDLDNEGNLFLLTLTKLYQVFY